MREVIVGAEGAPRLTGRASSVAGRPGRHRRDLRRGRLRDLADLRPRSGASRTASATSDRAAAVGSSTTTSTTRPRRGSGEPVVFAWRRHPLRGIAAHASSTTTRAGCSPRSPMTLERRGRRDGEPRDCDHRPVAHPTRRPTTSGHRRARSTALRAAGVDVVTMANNHGARLRARRASPTRSPRRLRACCRWSASATNATEAYAAVADRGARVSGSRSSARPTCSTTGLLHDVDRDRHAGRARVDQGRGPSTGSSCRDASGPTRKRHRRRLPALGRRRLDLPVGAPAGARPRPSSTPAPTSSSGVTRTGCRAAGRLDGAFVDYGLGNFVFYNESGESGRTGVLTVAATGRDVDTYQWNPARIVGGIPHPLTPPDSDAAMAEWDAQRACTGLSP